MTKIVRTLAVPVLALALTAAACSNNESSGSGSPSTSASGAGCTSDMKVGLALDVGGLGDNGFNDLAYAALQKTISDGVICDDNTKLIESNADGSNLDENVQSLAEAGYDIIVGTGFAFTTGINEIAPDYPDTKFGIVDGYNTCGTACGLTNEADATTNVVDLTFKEQEGSYLVGVAGALKAQELGCTNLGFLGGQTGPLIEKFQAGFQAGVAEIDPSIKVQVEYIGDSTKAFNDVIQGEALSNKMYDNGACIIYHAAGKSGNGLFKAAAAQQKLAIGVDSDQYNAVTASQAPYIFTSMIKRVDTAVYNMIKSATDGTFEGGNLVFDLKSDGISYSTSNTELMTQDIIDTVNEYKQKIIDGDIVPPEKPTKS
jgi:basic membrane protein A and related proteins